MKNKRSALVVTLLMVAILAGSISANATSATPDFVDVPSDAWYAEAVDFVKTHGLMQGMGENKFQPNTTMSRAMLVTVLWRIEDQPLEGTYYYYDYRDVQNDDWYTSAVAWASNLGIVQGTAPAQFSPNAPITREQIVTILYRYASDRNIATGARDDLSKFSDCKKVSEWALEAIQWAVGIGLIEGIPTDGSVSIQPQGNATRAQVATILKRFIEISSLPVPYILSRTYGQVLDDRMHRIGYGSLDSYHKKDCGGKLLDLNSDGTKELIIRYVHDYRLIFEIWTIENGTAVCVISEIFGHYANSGPATQLTQSEFRGDSYLTHHKEYGETAEMHEIWNLYQISDGAFTLKHQLHISYDYRDDDGNYTSMPSIKYYINQVEVTRAEFESAYPTVCVSILDTSRNDYGSMIDGCLPFEQLTYILS